jgi:ankyrin repeat protein
MEAAENGLTRTCALLIAKGADMDMVDENDVTALMIAERSEKTETASFLKSMEDIQQLMDKEGFKELVSSLRECTQ